MIFYRSTPHQQGRQAPILVFLALLRIANATGEHLKLEVDGLVFILGRTGWPGLQLLLDSGCCVKVRNDVTELIANAAAVCIVRGKGLAAFAFSEF